MSNVGYVYGHKMEASMTTKQNGNWLHESQHDADGRVRFYGENENGGGVFDWDDGTYSVHLHK